MLDGEPIEGRIKVYFHFAPPTQHQLEQHSDVFEMVVVHEENIDLEDSKIRMTLDEGDIARQATKDLAGIMEQTPGVVVAGGTTDSSKPIIRGHQERRLLVINDGIRHESQKWGADHATEIDPFTAGRFLSRKCLIAIWSGCCRWCCFGRSTEILNDKG